jgi:hypothetical protein
MGPEPWSAAERAGQKVLLIDGGQHLGRAALRVSRCMEAMVTGRPRKTRYAAAR